MMELDNRLALERVIERAASAADDLQVFFMTDSHLSYASFSQYDAVAIFPWNWEITLFKEAYALGLPVFLPSLHHIAVSISRPAEFTYVEIPHSSVLQRNL